MKAESQILREQREQKYPWSKGIGNRAWNALINRYDLDGPESDDFLKQELGNGSIERYRLSSLSRTRNFGWKSWLELCVWAGLDIPKIIKHKIVKHPCPRCQGRGWVRHWK